MSSVLYEVMLSPKSPPPGSAAVSLLFAPYFGHASALPPIGASPVIVSFRFQSYRILSAKDGGKRKTAACEIFLTSRRERPSLCCLLFRFFRVLNFLQYRLGFCRPLCCVAFFLHPAVSCRPASIRTIFRVRSCCDKGTAAVLANTFSTSVFSRFLPIKSCTTVRGTKQSV